MLDDPEPDRRHPSARLGAETTDGVENSDELSELLARQLSRLVCDGIEPTDERAVDCRLRQGGCGVKLAESERGDWGEAEGAVTASYAPGTGHFQPRTGFLEGQQPAVAISDERRDLGDE